MKTLWIILAAAGGAIALFFAFQEDYEKAFVAAVAGAVCWFLNYRRHIRESLAAHENSENEESE